MGKRIWLTADELRAVEESLRWSVKTVQDYRYEFKTHEEREKFKEDRLRSIRSALKKIRETE